MLLSILCTLLVAVAFYGMAVVFTPDIRIQVFTGVSAAALLVLVSLLVNLPPAFVLVLGLYAFSVGFQVEYSQL